MTSEEREALRELVEAVGEETSAWSAGTMYPWFDDASDQDGEPNDDCAAHARLYDAVQRVPRERWPESIATAMVAVDRARLACARDAVAPREEPRFKVGDRVEVNCGGEWVRGTVDRVDASELGGQFDASWGGYYVRWFCSDCEIDSQVRHLVETPAQPDTLPAPPEPVPDYPATCTRSGGLLDITTPRVIGEG